MLEGQWILLVGFIAPFVIQIIKTIYTKVNGFEMSEKLALNTTYVVAVLAAAIGKWLTGEAFIPQGDLSTAIPVLVAQFAVVLGSATFIYKTLI
ncbi:hypothetical protein IMZ48_42490, partial [Candidatus Bathyarchaeota archaeon]|nr:hypothetical protein [Candidatus Bathyarchaeota archaeon]